MKLTDYLGKISDLPLKDPYAPEDILTKDFLIANERSMEIYYCCHNEFINPYARVFIVGITP